MKLPTTLRIGYRDYEVIDWERQDSEGAARFGECHVDRAVIRVCQDYGPVKSANTLLHEVLHAAWAQGRLDAKAEEEKAVSVLADQLTQVIRDNPDFVAFMTASLLAAGEE